MTTTLETSTVISPAELRAVIGIVGDARRPAGTGAYYPVPSEAALDGEFTPAPDLEKIGIALIAHHGLVAGQYTVRYFWKDKGGKSKGNLTLGKCTKPTGLLHHFAECDFVIWLAADHLRDAYPTATEVEAVVYHELRHAGETEPDEESDEPAQATIIGHEFEGFLDEVTLYGATVRNLKPIVNAAKQLELGV
ncbi:MAG TPA: putative metallopeptidase [Chloroflexota bacterium]|nr:putative metallopeptidase [Chloroflexota bacterium]